MNSTELILNGPTDSIGKVLKKLAQGSSLVSAVVAFVSSEDLPLKWAAVCPKVRLVVRLSYPTSPSALRRLLGERKIDISYLTTGLHEKSVVFYKQGEPSVVAVGSANFSVQALGETKDANIEAALVVRDRSLAQRLSVHHDSVARNAAMLTGDVVDDYELVYQKHLEAQTALPAVRPSTPMKVVRISKTVLEWSKFVSQMQSLRPVLEPEVRSRRAYTDLPFYPVFDSFFHYLKTEYGRTKAYRNPVKISDPTKREQRARRLFIEYLDGRSELNWVRDGLRSTTKLAKKSYVSALSKSQANTFYSCLNCSARPRAVHGPKVLTDTNHIRKIRKALTYLLHSDDPIHLRLQNYLSQPALRLANMGKSFAREVPGWVFPSRYPACNEKSLGGMRFLGFS